MTDAIHRVIQKSVNGNVSASNLQQVQPVAKQTMCKHMVDAASCKDEDADEASSRFSNHDVYKLALVTGASSGLGKALCEELAKRRIPLILVARNEEKLKDLALTLPVLTYIHATDLSDPAERKKLVQLIHQKQPDLVINNAGFGLYGPVLAHPSSEMDQMVQVNVQALMEITIESASALMKAGKKGTILNVSSAAAFFSYPSFCVYAATKAFVNRFSEGLDAELKPRGIRVLTVCPGKIDTPFRVRASGNHPQQKSSFTMEPKTAAELILKQIESGKTLSIIDWRYRCLIALIRLLPDRLLQVLLKGSLKKRHKFSEPL